MFPKVLFVALLSLAMASNLWCQIDCKGKITDEYGDVIQGAHISDREGVVLEVSNNNGFFELSISEEDSFSVNHIRFEQVLINYSWCKTDTVIKMTSATHQLPTAGITESLQNTGSQTDMAYAEKISGYMLAQQNNGSVSDALNIIPGVQMENRGIDGSRRLSVRGSLLRSPFGVRNVKVYLDNMPITNPDGSTPMEIIDPEFISAVTVMKGPSGALYGAGLGGTLLFQSKDMNDGTQFNVGSLYNTTGMLKSFGTVSTDLKGTKISLDYVNVENPGYRIQEFNRKNMLILRGVNQPKTNQEIGFNLLLYDGYWGLPGSIDSTKAASEPTAANDKSVLYNAHVHRRWIKMGLYNNIKIRNNVSSNTLVYGTITGKQNPYGTSPFFQGYKKEEEFSGGVRSVLNTKIERKGKDWDLNLGLEVFTGTNSLMDHVNEDGQPGDVTLNALTAMSGGFVFGNLVIPFTEKLTVQATYSYNILNYDYKNKMLHDSLDNTDSRMYMPLPIPRLSLNYAFSTTFSTFAAFSSGFSPPTLWEILETDGTLNNNLKAETGNNAEAGIVIHIPAKVYGKISAFYTDLTDMIIPYEDSLGILRYSNSGSAVLSGVETMWRFYVPGNRGVFNGFYPWISASLNQYTFGEYDLDGDSYNGNSIPGIPDWQLNQGFRLKLFQLLFLDQSLKQYGARMLNNENTDHVKGYTLVDCGIGATIPLTKTIWELKFSVNNALGENYSGYFQLNSFGGKYYNPAPSRNFSFSLKMNWRK